MDKIFSIGFTKKKAEIFFELLMSNDVKKLIDVRLNNSSQLAGFTKGDDLNYFLKKIAGIHYVHELIFAPTKEILDSYKKGNIDWVEYEKEYIDLMKKRNVYEYIKSKGREYWVESCLLCSEETAEKCHRRLAINTIKEIYPDLDVIHIA